MRSFVCVDSFPCLFYSRLLRDSVFTCGRCVRGCLSSHLPVCLLLHFNLPRASALFLHCLFLSVT